MIATTLVPGLRALRAPLVAGLAWCLSAWLALEPYLPPADEVTGVYASLRELEGIVGSVGELTLVAFVAYLVGSLLSTVVFGVLSLLERAMQAAWAVLPWPLDEPAWRVGSYAETLAGLIDRGASDDGSYDVIAMVGERVNQADASLEATGQSLTQPEVYQRLGRALGIPPHQVRTYMRRATPDADGGGPGDPGLTLDDVMRLVFGAATDDLSRVHLRLTDHPTLFGEIDRYRAESQLRASLLPPIAALAGVVAARSTGYATVLVGLIGLGIAWALMGDARRSSTAANTAIVNALRLDLTDIPAFEKLDAYVSGLKIKHDAAQLDFVPPGRRSGV